jgi:hypothetical protein
MSAQRETFAPLRCQFDFRYSNRVALGVNDMEHAEKLARGIVGKRLTYRRSNEAGL